MNAGEFRVFHMVYTHPDQSKDTCEIIAFDWEDALETLEKHYPDSEPELDQCEIVGWIH